VDWEPGDGEHDGDNGDKSCHTLLVLKDNEKLVSNCSANEGSVRIRNKCLVPMHVFPKMKLRGLAIFKTEL
jgi:hypothetical protein